MQLANNEHIIREWEYATSKTGVADLNKTKATLTVTNKRIVHDMRNKLEISRDEIQLQDVKTLHMSHATKSKVGPVMTIILGIIIMIVGIVLSAKAGVAALLPVFLVLGGIIVVVGILKLQGGALTLTITTRLQEGSSLGIGAFGGKGLGKKNKGTLKVVVNNAIASEIVDMIGAIIIDSQAKEVTVADFAAQR